MAAVFVENVIILMGVQKGAQGTLNIHNKCIVKLTKGGVVYEMK